MGGQKMTGDSGKMTTLKTVAEKKAFKFFQTRELYRHLDDCLHIMSDLYRLRKYGPKINDDTLAEWLEQAATISGEIMIEVPGVEKWIEVPK